MGPAVQNHMGFAVSTQASSFNDLWTGLLRHRILPGGIWQNDERTVMVSGLPFDTTEHDVYKMCSPFGGIAPGGVKVMLNADGSCKGTAMVNYLELESSQKAVKSLNNCMLPDGRLLQLRIYISNANKGKGKGAAGPVAGAGLGIPGLVAGPMPQAA